MLVTLICQHVPCSKPFTVYPYRKDTALFCSRACKQAAMVLLPDERKTVTLECRSCHQPFVVDYYKKDTAHYCSIACHAEGKRKPTEPVICAYCGQSFIVELHRVGKARFCSMGCHDNWRAAQSLAAFWTKIQICAHGFDCPYCCWPFRGETANKYRQTHLHNQPIGAHRLAWELGNNRTMPPDRQAAHFCHFRACCNFDHLHSATTVENYADSIRDHRIAAGEQHHNSKLTEETALEAFHLKVQGLTNQGIADHLHVSKSTITNLLAGLIWKDLPRPPVLPKLKPGPRPRQSPLL
jgi:hypothetical protein